MFDDREDFINKNLKIQNYRIKKNFKNIIYKERIIKTRKKKNNNNYK